MKNFCFFSMIACALLIVHGVARADGRAGTIEFSDGHKLSGTISLTPGKQLRLFTATAPVTVALEEVKEIRFTPEKEQTREGYYFPDAGQTTQTKTGEIYPVRYIQTEITLADGKTLDGHLFTTTGVCSAVKAAFVRSIRTKPAPGAGASNRITVG